MLRKKYRKIKKFRRFKHNFKLFRIRGIRRIIGPQRNARNLGKAFIYKRSKRAENAKRELKKQVSSKINLNLFGLSYDVLLSYHSPLGKKVGEWKPGIMLTNVLMIRNQVSILDLTSIFFELRKVVNRLFKSLKLRKGIAVLNGRRYSWTKIFTFVFERWLPGFITNFRLNIKELISYFFKRKCLTRRQRNRILSLKMLSYDRKFLASFRNKKKGEKKVDNIISYLKLPSVSMSLIDSLYWMRECQKQAVTMIQVADTGSDIDRINYPLISNQKSLAFLSFLTLLAKEVAYQARYWELTNFKEAVNYYMLNVRLTNNNRFYGFKSDLVWWKSKLMKYEERLALGYKKSRRFEIKADYKINLRKELKKK